MPECENCERLEAKIDLLLKFVENLPHNWWCSTVLKFPFAEKNADCDCWRRDFKEAKSG